MASPVAVDRRPIRVITGWHLPGRDHNDNGCFAGRLHPTCCLHRARRCSRARSPPVALTLHLLVLRSAFLRYPGVTNRRVTAALVIRGRRCLLLAGDQRGTSRSGDLARVRWLRSIEKRLRFFIARNRARFLPIIRKKGM